MKNKAVYTAYVAPSNVPDRRDDGHTLSYFKLQSRFVATKNVG